MNNTPDGLIFTDGEDFWKHDPATQLYRVVDFAGEFYPLHTHPGVTLEQLRAYFPEKALKTATETDIIWRTVNWILSGLQQANWMPRM